MCVYVYVLTTDSLCNLSFLRETVRFREIYSRPSQHGIVANLSSEDSIPRIIDSTVNNYRKRNWPWAGLGHAISGDANISVSPNQEAMP